MKKKFVSSLSLEKVDNGLVHVDDVLSARAWLKICIEDSFQGGNPNLNDILDAVDTAFDLEDLDEDLVVKI